MELGRVKAKIANYAKDKNVDVQVAWDTFFFDEFIHRLSISKYKNDFIFKGGFYLQSILGIETRSTMDIDFKLTKNDVTNDELLRICQEIIDLNTNNISFSITKIEEIRQASKYGGKTISIVGKFFNITKRFSVDIDFGDIVTPDPIFFEYKNALTDENYEVLSYTIESIIAEKFETLISKGVNNSRSKDLLDLYLLNQKGFDRNLLNCALINTFYSRKTQFDSVYINNTIDEVFSFDRIQELYENYTRKNSFAKNVSFSDCEKAVREIKSHITFREKIDLAAYGVEVHVVRHGEDDRGRIGGWSDNQLTEIGINQVKELSNIIDDEYDLIISSDLNRAKETAIILNNKLKNKIQFDERYREVNNGQLKNLSKAEFMKNYTQFIFSRLKMDQPYPGGESPNDFYKRIKNSFIDLVQKNKDEKILLVTHGGVITVITCLIYGFKYSNLLKLNIPLASVTKFK
ncbi:MAG: nucleotidyl transferase AbiEii/AbiGii toxin family protein [Bacilli bacterium]|jgi:broad specificity phosphatase PhoE/predicted nucleotidyltransferase component of viral defense system|nr:nucleotidyl transferase AbiEii/AbiGii toxin family protein [Bacilli bacterium]